MAFGEIYTAMKPAFWTGLEHSAALVQANKFNEVAGNYTLTRHLFGPVAFVCSTAFMGRLDEDQKAQVLAEADFAADLERALAPAREQQALDALAAEGMTITEIDTAPLQDATRLRAGPDRRRHRRDRDPGTDPRGGKIALLNMKEEIIAETTTETAPPGAFPAIRYLHRAVECAAILLFLAIVLVAVAQIVNRFFLGNSLSWSGGVPALRPYLAGAAGRDHCLSARRAYRR